MGCGPDKRSSARDLLESARGLRKLTAAWGALLFVNDRLDVALAAGADGVHLGPHDLPVSLARGAAPDHFLIGHSTDVPEVAKRAVQEGADYIGCGAVFPTDSKKDAGEVIGISRLARVAEAVPGVRVKRLAFPDAPPPGAPEMINYMKVNADDIVAAAKKLAKG